MVIGQGFTIWGGINFDNLHVSEKNVRFSHCFKVVPLVHRVIRLFDFSYSSGHVVVPHLWFSFAFH